VLFPTPSTEQVHVCPTFEHATEYECPPIEAAQEQVEPSTAPPQKTPLKLPAPEPPLLEALAVALLTPPALLLLDAFAAALLTSPPPLLFVA
jgi:hypothetical protein